jgi:hypothetical protein
VTWTLVLAGASVLAVAGLLLRRPIQVPLVAPAMAQA